MRALINMSKTYEHFFNLSNDMLCIAGLDGYFKLLNPAFEKTLGFTKEELCAKPYYEFIHPEDRAKKYKNQKKMCCDTSVVCCEERYLCKDGSYKWLSWTDYTDVASGLIYAVARDITAQRHTEEALQKARDELELRVRERTAELLKANEELTAEILEREKIGRALKESEMKLMHANKMTALGILVSGIAHEINNPNSFIMTNAGLLSDIWKEEVGEIIAEHYRKNSKLPSGRPFSDLREIMPKLLNGISSGALRIQGIIDSLRGLSRPARSGMDEKIDINKVIAASETILGNQIKKCTDNFNIRWGKKIPAVKGNSQQIEQVIINLIMNSLQALPDKGRGVLVSTSFSKKSDRVIIKVKDEGIGMSREIYERIREPFFTTKIESGGTGLGLSISYDIIKRHKGTLEFESSPGEGTTAIIKLPSYK